MSTDNGTQEEKKLCPFLNSECIQNKCMMWTALNMTETNALGTVQAVKRFMCSFQAQLILQSVPRTQQVVNPMSLPRIGRRN